KENTTLVDGKGDPASIKGRIEQIRRAIEDTNSEYDKEKLQERLAKMAGGVAVINVGGHSEVEVKERKDRVDDALAATRAAVEEGYVPGGGVSLIRAAVAVESMTFDGEDERLGAQLVARAAAAPLAQIARNAGLEPEVVVYTVRN